MSGQDSSARIGGGIGPKWDGFRCLAARDGEQVELSSRHARPFARYFREIVSAMASVEQDRWLLDGELLVLVDGRFDFAALMQRLHPAASRVRELAAHTPAIYIAFDLVVLAGDTCPRRRSSTGANG